MGRPRIIAELKKSQQLNVRFLAKDLELVKMAARKNNLSVSDWIRKTVVAAASRRYR